MVRYSNPKCPYHEYVSFFSPASKNSPNNTSILEGPSNGTSSTQLQLPYNYVPTEWLCISFLSLFVLSTCLLAFFSYFTLCC